MNHFEAGFYGVLGVLSACSFLVVVGVFIFMLGAAIHGRVTR